MGQTEVEFFAESAAKENKMQKTSGEQRAKEVRAEGFGRANTGLKQTSAKGPRTSVAMSP